MSIALVVLLLAMLACTTPGLTVPPTITAVVIETAATIPQATSVPATPVAAAPSDTPVLASPTAVASPTPIPATPTVTATPALTGTTKLQTNIRSGPGFGYRLLATLAPSLSVKLTGRNADKSWWQIEFPASPDGHGWVLAANINVGAVAQADALPIANAPPLPTRLPVVATAAPASSAAFRADKAELSPGECTTLRWDVDNVEAVFLDSGSGDNPVVGHDTLVVCPDDTFTYTLRVVNKDKSERRLAYTVKMAGCGGAAIISRFEASAEEVKAGSNVLISWVVACAQTVYLKEGSKTRAQVTGRGDEEFQPSQTTSYRLIAMGKDGSRVERELTVKVVP